MLSDYVGGNLALDFVGTLNERNRARVEHLNDAHDVVAWLRGAGVLDTVADGDSDSSESALTEALRLREALFTVIASLIDSTPMSEPEQVAVVNAAAAAPPPLVRVTPDGRVDRSGGVEAGLSAVARDGIALFEQQDGRLKWCADQNCTHPFLDRSRGHRRRWCGMAGCGDRAKAAAYRARRRSSERRG